MEVLVLVDTQEMVDMVDMVLDIRHQQNLTIVLEEMVQVVLVVEEHTAVDM